MSYLGNLRHRTELSRKIPYLLRSLANSLIWFKAGLSPVSLYIRILMDYAMCTNLRAFLSGTAGKELIRHMLCKPMSGSVFRIAKDLDLLALTPSATPTSTSSESDEDPLIAFCESAILAMPSEVSAARNGNKNVLNKIIGVVIKQSRGRLDARRVREVIEQMVFGESRPPS